MSYPGVRGHYFEKGATMSMGSYVLDESYGCEFGEPAVVIGTGTTAIPQNKKTVKSYDHAEPGREKCIGVFTEWRRAVDGFTAEDMALHGRQDFKRDISILKAGGCTVKNVGNSIIYDGERTTPANGGAERLTASGQFSLGIAKQDIQPGQYGLINIQPDEEKIQT